MGIESRHAYRYGYLRSDEWKQLRLKVLSRDNAHCFICGERSLENDIHHVFYRANWKETRASDCFVLCRRCHDEIHKQLTPFLSENRTRKELRKIFHQIADHLRKRFRPPEKKPSDYLREAYYKVCAERDDLKKQVEHLQGIVDRLKSTTYVRIVEQSDIDNRSEPVQSGHSS